MDTPDGDLANKGYIQHEESFVNQPVGLEDIETEFEKLVEKREAMMLPAARAAISSHDVVDGGGGGGGNKLQVKGGGLTPPVGNIRRARSTER